MHTYTLQDRGYDCDQHGKSYDCTAESFLEAIRMLDGFADAKDAQPINDIPGCSTYAVYKFSASGTHYGTPALSKIGCVWLSRKQPA